MNCLDTSTALNKWNKNLHIHYLNLLYKHRWNTKWAFARKLHIFTVKITGNHHTWRYHRRYGYIINRASFTGEISSWTLEDIEDITCPRVDMNFIFEWSTRYLTSERSERVRYRVDHEKIKFISISGHVIFCLLYKHQWNTKPFYFNIFNGLTVERVVTKHGRT